MRRLLLAALVLGGCASARTDDAEVLASSPVPKQIGNARLTEADIFPRYRPGTGYRYRDGDLRADVYLFMKGDMADTRTQTDDFLKELRIMRLRGEYDSYQILVEDAVEVTNGTQIIAGHEVVFRSQRRARQNDEYFAVLALPEQYARFRITQPVDPASADEARAFVRAWLTAHLQ
jgi:hypothetical protein